MELTSKKESFDRVAPDAQGFVELGGYRWQAWFWDSPTIRRLERIVSAGKAGLTESHDGRIRLKISVPDLVRCEIEYARTFDDFLTAAEAAENFQWKSTETAGHKWYCTREEENEWVTVMGDGDVATVNLYRRDGTYGMKRSICLRHGESYEISASRYNSTDGDHAVTTFAEAAAIAVTLPAFVAVLGSK